MKEELTINYEKLRQELEQEAMKPQRCKPWTEDEVRLLREFHNKVPDKVLAAKLGRTVASIRQKSLNPNIK